MDSTDGNDTNGDTPAAATDNGTALCDQTATSTSATEAIALSARQPDQLRLVVSGFQKFMNAKEVTKILAQGKIDYESLKRAVSTTVAVLRFASVEQREKAATDLVKICVKGRPLRTMVPKPEERRIFHQQDHEQCGSKRKGKLNAPREPDGKRGREGSVEGGGDTLMEESVKTLADVVTPFLSLPYMEQLQQKERDIAVECVQKTFREIKKSYADKNKQLKRAYQHGEGGSDSQPRHVRAPNWAWGGRYAKETFVVEPIAPSPCLEGYRNKCEFTVGRDQEGRPTVGFRMGAFRNGVMQVGGLEEGCVLLDALTQRVVAALQAFIRRRGALPVYDQMTHEGVWRYVTVRTSSRTKQCLVCVCAAIEKQGADWAREQAALVDYLTATTPVGMEGEAPTPGEAVEGESREVNLFSTTSGPSVSMLHAPSEKETSSDKGDSVVAPHGAWTGVTSLFLAPYEGLSNPSADEPLIHLWGSPYLEEELLGLRFRISPQAFFQVNTAGAEVLYQKVIDESLGRGGKKGDGAAEAPRLILDVCCGTGTIGICAAKQLEGRVQADREIAEDPPGTSTQQDNIAALKEQQADVATSLVLGIEICERAVEDAVENARQNRVGCAAFLCSRAEDILLSVLREKPVSSVPVSPPLPTSTGNNATTPVSGGRSGHHVAEEKLAGLSAEVRAALQAVLVDQNSASAGSKTLVAAIVDPPRSGLHADCLRALRNCRHIQRLVYVSCNPSKSLPRDAVALCGPPSQRLKGEAFRPVKAIPVDMFPHTSHCEVVMVFERGDVEIVSENSVQGPDQGEVQGEQRESVTSQVKTET